MVEKIHDLDFFSSESDEKISPATDSLMGTLLIDTLGDMYGATLTASSGENRRYLSTNACIAKNLLLGENLDYKIKIYSKLEEWN